MVFQPTNIVPFMFGGVPIHRHCSFHVWWWSNPPTLFLSCLVVFQPTDIVPFVFGGVPTHRHCSFHVWWWSNPPTLFLSCLVVFQPTDIVPFVFGGVPTHRHCSYFSIPEVIANNETSRYGAFVCITYMPVVNDTF